MNNPLRAVGFALILAFLSVMPAAATPAAIQTPGNSVSVVDQRPIEVPGNSWVGMSPDGRSVATVKPEMGRSEQLCVYEMETLAEMSCGDLAAREIRMHRDSIAWSPDGARIAFNEVALDLLVDGDIWVMETATGELRNVTDDGYSGTIRDAPAFGVFLDLAPAWSPDGRSLAFSRSPAIDDFLQSIQLVTLDLVGGEVDTLVTLNFDPPAVVYQGIAWAPDGRHVIYSAFSWGEVNSDSGIWMIDADGRNARQVLSPDPELGEPALLEIAATGDRALVYYPRAFQIRFEPNYAVLDLQTSAVTPLALPTDVAEDATILLATWSPDGVHILVGVVSDDPGEFLAIHDPSTSEVTRLEVDISDLRLIGAGRGLNWGANGTIFVPTGSGAALLVLTADGLSGAWS